MRKTSRMQDIYIYGIWQESGVWSDINPIFYTTNQLRGKDPAHKPLTK